MILLWVTKISESKCSVDGANFVPFDKVHGLGKTKESLEAEGHVFVDVFLQPEDNGKSAKHYVNPQTKEQWYEYSDIPKTEIELLREEFKNYQAEQDLLLMQVLLGGTPQ